MKRIDTKELKKIQIEILDVLVDFCEKNNITYWIDSGTLLGAIRHKGYIPWDDDIDVGMLREDFDKLAELFNKSNDRYKFYCFENNNKFYYPYGKVLDTNTILYEPDKNGMKLAVNIDVFVYDNAPDDDKKMDKMFKKRDFLNKLRDNKIYAKSIDTLKSKIKSLILIPISLKLITKKLVKNSKKYVNLETKRVGNFTAYSKSYCEKDVFDSFVDKEFEGKLYKVPVGYDKWLRAFYGDYMQLPPKEKRVTHHSFEAYYKDK